MRIIPAPSALLFCLGILACFMQALAHADAPPAPANIFRWARMNLLDFGCMLEKEYGYRHPKFNCSLKHYRFPTSPCEGSPDYDIDIVLPDTVVGRINPLFDQMMLTFEQGNLMWLNITFRQAVPPEQLKTLLHLPEKNSSPPEYPNVMSWDLTPQHLYIDGFEHTGAADLDTECPEKTPIGKH